MVLLSEILDVSSDMSLREILSPRLHAMGM